MSLDPKSTDRESPTPAAKRTESRSANPSSPTPVTKRAKAYSDNVAVAIELPFTFVGAVGVGVAIGYFLDRWLHTRAIFMIIFGALGFIAGLREVIRRLPGASDGTKGS